MAPDMAQVYTDFSGLAALRARAREDKEAALDQVSRQFESLFVQMMLKSMREASFGGGLLDSQQSDSTATCMTSRLRWTCRASRASASPR